MRAKATRDLKDFMKEIGQDHLLMSNEQAKVYHAEKILKRVIIPKIRKWRAENKA